MKWFWIVSVFLTQFTFAAGTKPTSHRSPTNANEASNSTAATSSPTKADPMTSSPTSISGSNSASVLVAAPLDPLPLIHLSTNFIDLAQGKSNFLIDFFNFKKRFHVNFRSYFSAEQETVDKNGAPTKLTVNRSALGIGVSWYAYDINSARNWVISPALVFGKTDDAEDTSSQAGLGLKATALFRIGDRMTVETGLLSDTIHSNHRNAIHIGLGYFL